MSNCEERTKWRKKNIRIERKMGKRRGRMNEPVADVRERRSIG
jgi:hypothetical protein